MVCLRRCGWRYFDKVSAAILKGLEAEVRNTSSGEVQLHGPTSSNVYLSVPLRIVAAGCFMSSNLGRKRPKEKRKYRSALALQAITANWDCKASCDVDACGRFSTHDVRVFSLRGHVKRGGRTALHR